MKATLIARRRFEVAANTFAEMVVWEVPEPVPSSQHRFKYRLVLIHRGKRILGFDNERGMGDHRRDGAVEIPYLFRDIDHLIADFLAAIDEWSAR